jgi:YVTN family beta-propeller protein
MVFILGVVVFGTAALLGGARPAAAASAYHVYVTNEKSGDVTVIDPGTHTVVATIPVGKRPRGIHVSPDGKTVYVAVSGTPVSGPPELDAHGNPILKKNTADDDDDAGADKAADGIAVVDVASNKFIRKGIRAQQGRLAHLHLERGHEIGDGDRHRGAKARTHHSGGPGARGRHHDTRWQVFLRHL